MKFKPVQWFREVWPTREKRWTVLNAYKAIPQAALADIALRGFLYSDVQVPGDPYATHVNIGRQQLAQEIFDLCKANPQVIFDSVERQPANGDRK